MKKIILTFFAYVLISVPAHAQKWATATFHTSRPIDQVFEPTADLINTKSWYLGTRWYVVGKQRSSGTLEVISKSFGAQYGTFYITISPEATGTSIQAIMSLVDGTYLHPADYALRFAKGLKKLFPDITWTIQRNAVPEDFTLTAGALSMPPLPVAIPAAPPAVPSSSSPAVVYGTAPITPAQITSIDNSLQNISASLRPGTYTAPVTPPVQSPAANPGSGPITPAQVASIDNSLQNVSASLRPGTYTAPVVVPMQNYAPQQQIAIGKATEDAGLAMIARANEMEAEAAGRRHQLNAASASYTASQFLTYADQEVRRYMTTTGSDAKAQYEGTATAINKARKAAYDTLTDPNQKIAFNSSIYPYMTAFEKQMNDHVSQQTSANRVQVTDQVPKSSEDSYTENLHHVLDSWYAADKDWHKIPPEMWNKLTERDKGRLRDGIDPETVNVQASHAEQTPQ